MTCSDLSRLVGRNVEVHLIPEGSSLQLCLYDEEEGLSSYYRATLARVETGRVILTEVYCFFYDKDLGRHERDRTIRPEVAVPLSQIASVDEL